MTPATEATSLEKTAPETTSLETTSRRDFAVIATLVVAAFTVILNETTMNIAISEIMTGFRVSEGTAQWLSTGFLLTMGVFIPTTGFLMQKFSTRALYMGAMSVFCLGTLIAGLAPIFPVLVLGRVVQALGTGLMMPLLMTVILTLVPLERRGAAIGLVVVVIAVAPAIGPTLSGLIMGFLSWRWVFLLILPIALAALAYGAKTLVNVTEVSDPTLDVPSVFLSALAFGGIVFGFSRVGGEGAATGAAANAAAQAGSAGSAGGGVSAFGVGALVVGALALAVFVRRQLSIQSPLLDLRAFRFPMFALAMAILAGLALSLFGSFLLLPLYLQNVRHLDAFHAGLVLLPGGVVLGVASPIAGRIFDQSGPRALTVIGASFLVLSLAVLSTATANTPLVLIIGMNCAMMLAMSMLMTPVQTTGLNQLPRHLHSHGTAINGTVQQVAGAIGTALIVTVMTLRAKAFASGIAAPNVQQKLAATTYGLQQGFAFAAVVALVTLGMVLFLRRVAPPDAEAQEEHAKGEREAEGLVLAGH